MTSVHELGRTTHFNHTRQVHKSRSDVSYMCCCIPFITSSSSVRSIQVKPIRKVNSQEIEARAVEAFNRIKNPSSASGRPSLVFGASLQFSIRGASQKEELVLKEAIEEIIHAPDFASNPVYCLVKKMIEREKEEKAQGKSCSCWSVNGDDTSFSFNRETRDSARAFVLGQIPSFEVFVFNHDILKGFLSKQFNLLEEDLEQIGRRLSVAQSMDCQKHLREVIQKARASADLKELCIAEKAFREFLYGFCILCKGS